MYIALYNGNIVVIFNQGVAIQSALHTFGLSLNDGLEHNILVDFTELNR